MTSGQPPANDNKTVVSSYIPAPLRLPAFPQAQRARGKTIMPGGGLRQRWKSPSGAIDEWDYQHGRLKPYDRRGRHVGEFDPNTGARTKPANPHDKVEP
jgi:hypothetical protein